MKCKLSASQGASLGRQVLSEELGLQKLLEGREGRPALVVLGSSFHQRGTTNENSLDCRACTDGSDKRRSLDERSVLGVTFTTITQLNIAEELCMTGQVDSVDACLSSGLSRPLTASPHTLFLIKH